MKHYHLLLPLLGLLSHGAAAQTGPPAPDWTPRRWTVGVQAAFYPRVAFADYPDSQGNEQSVRPWPLMPTLAYRVRHQASVEIGLLLRAAPATVVSTVDNFSAYTYRTRTVTWMLPIVTRLHLTVPPASRWQASFALGIMPVSSRRSSEITSTDIKTGQTYSSGSSSSSYNDAHFLAGFGGGYVIAPRLTLTADARLTFSPLAAILGQVFAKYSSGPTPSPFFGAFSAGLSYHFGPALH
ncbi:MAG: hypothetical protein M3Y12_09680 [Bacteroidota bacterium]|nr:hypothetical protein [Bacteroidota bacterium]